MSTTTTAPTDQVTNAPRRPAAGPSRRRAWAPYLILIVLATIYILPFLIQVSTSFKTEPEAAVNPIGLIPENWTTAAYERLFRFSDYAQWGMNSFIVTLVVTAGRVFFDSLAGYALARIPFRGRGVVFEVEGVDVGAVTPGRSPLDVQVRRGGTGVPGATDGAHRLAPSQLLADRQPGGEVL